MNRQITSEQEIQALLDRESIRTVLYRYCRAVDRGDRDLMKSCYHEDGTDDHGFFSGSGWEFADYVLPILAQLELSIHSLTNPHIDLAGDRAYVETQWSVIHRLRRFGKLTDMWHQGRYLDEFERRNGEWKIFRRVTVSDAERWVHTADLQRLVPDSNPRKVYRGRRGHTDPLYSIEKLHLLSRAEFRLDELWRPLIQVLRLPLTLLHILGSIVQSRGHGETQHADH
jgi:hypothetical protein